MGRIFFAISLWLALTICGHAETIGTFSLESYADQARAIARGSWHHGHFTPEFFFKGNEKAFFWDTTRETDRKIAASLQSWPEQSAPETLTVFIPYGGISSTGVIVETPQAPWARTLITPEAASEFPTRGDAATWEKMAFSASEWIGAVSASVQRQKDRDTLLTMEPGPDRVHRLFKLLAETPPNPEEDTSIWRSSLFVHLNQLRGKLTLSKPEQKQLLELMQDNPSATRNVLHFFRFFPAEADLLSELTPFLKAPPRSTLRMAALEAIGAMNSEEAHTLLLQLVKHQDEDQSTIVRSFAIPQQVLLSPANLEELSSIAREVENPKNTKPDQTASQTADAILDLLDQLRSPLTLDILASWSFQKALHSERAYGMLCRISGVDFGRDNEATWRQWLDATRPLLATTYSVKTPAAMESWFQAWSKAPDDHVRQLMERRLLSPDGADFETLFEQTLVPANSAAAKATLSTLWDKGVLPPFWRREIARRFFGPLKITETRLAGAQREITIQAAVDFPLPKNARVQQSGDFTIGSDRALQGRPAEGRIRRPLSNQEPLWKISRNIPGTPTVRAVCEIWEDDPKNRSRDLWSHKLEAGPAPLDTPP